MSFDFDWYANKNGWKTLVVEKSEGGVTVEIQLTDKEALELYKYIGENFDVESLQG